LGSTRYDSFLPVRIRTAAAVVTRNSTPWLILGFHGIEREVRKIDAAPESEFFDLLPQPLAYLKR